MEPRALQRTDLQVELIDNCSGIYPFRNAHCLTTQYSPVFLCTVHLWRFNLKIAWGSSSNSGGRLWISSERISKLDSGCHANSSALAGRLPFVKMTIQLCIYSAPERFSAGWVQPLEFTTTNSSYFVLRRKGHPLVTRHFWKASDTTFLSSWACSEKVEIYYSCCVNRNRQKQAETQTHAQSPVVFSLNDALKK